MPDAQRDQRVMTLVETVLSQPPELRNGYLADACNGDQELFEEVTECVHWNVQMGSFLQQPLMTVSGADKPFKPGEMISERFQIIREVGEGGMGVVYEAFDSKREQRIAIKAAKIGFRRLLTPELGNALKVRHPNVCLVNEIHTAQSGSGEVDFITMELLSGETLAARLTREGKIESGDALEIVRQLCAGVSEAHRSGVIHCDLKSSNVFLTCDDAGKLRVVITDFGLALGASASLAQPAGTPQYMAPELWNGGHASKASDVYALGVLIYQMVAGHQSFHDTSQAPSGKLPRPLTSVVEGLDKRWDSAILPCLNFDPELRPSDAAKISERLDRKKISKIPFAIAALLPLVALIPAVRDPILQWWSPPHIRLAVLPFGSPSDVHVQIGGALQDVMDRLRGRRSGGTNIVLITPAEAAANGIRNPADADRILHATHTLEGKVVRQGQDLVADANIVDSQTQARLGHFSERYSAATLAAMPQALAGSVSLALRLQGKVPQENLSKAATDPYLRALFFLRRDGTSFDDAIPLLLQAKQADPRSPLPLAGLTEAWLLKFKTTSERSWLDKAQSSYKSAEALNADSVRVRLVGGMINEASGRYEKALADYGRVVEVDPKNADALLGIANVYNSMDMPDQAVTAYRNAIQSEPGYYAPYQNFGVYYFFRGQYQEAAEQFQNAIDRAPGLLRGYTNLGACLVSLGRDDEAEKAFTSALKIKVTASALNGIGAIRTYHERDAEAAGFFERALELDAHNVVVLMNLADSYRRTGRSSDAAPAYRRAMATASEALRNNPKRGYMRAIVGYLAARLGDRGRAAEEIGQALEFSPSDQQVVRQAVLTYEVLNERQRAIETLERASLAMIHELGRIPDLKSLQADPRFLELKQHYQLTEPNSQKEGAGR